MMGMVVQPNEVQTDPQVVLATQRYGTGLTRAQPTRAELPAALEA
jgi:hypothetical protein